MQLYLANLAWWATDTELEAMCAEYGKVRGRGVGLGAHLAVVHPMPRVRTGSSEEGWVFVSLREETS